MKGPARRSHDAPADNHPPDGRRAAERFDRRHGPAGAERADRERRHAAHPGLVIVERLEERVFRARVGSGKQRVGSVLPLARVGASESGTSGLEVGSIRAFIVIPARRGRNSFRLTPAR
jgi:hypothetical protein